MICPVFFLAPAIQIAFQWEKAVLLRVGKLRGIRDPGIFGLIPIMDRVTKFVDQRVRVTDFQAETTLRNAIGKNDLATLLSERDRLGEEIQRVLDEKTNGWGITTQAVEIRDIIIPVGLEDAMSRQAQAERERQSRIILGTAETEIATKFAEASIPYKDNPVALHLRAMNMVYEGLRNKGSMVIVPSSIMVTPSAGTFFHETFLMSVSMTCPLVSTLWTRNFMFDPVFSKMSPGTTTSFTGMPGAGW